MCGAVCSGSVQVNMYKIWSNYLESRYNIKPFRIYLIINKIIFTNLRILDRHGVLRQARHEPRRAQRTGDDDSDEDNFFDRTGDVEKKRLKKTQVPQSTAFTYDQLLEQEQEILDKIQTKEHKLELMVQIEKRQKMQNNEDLDDFMNNLSSMDSNVDKFTISTTKTEIQNLKVEHQKIQKLINIAKPSITLPPITGETRGKLPLFGKRNSLSRNFGVKRSEVSPAVKKVETFKVEEEVEEEVLPVKQQELENQAELKKADLPSTSNEKELSARPTAAPSKKLEKLKDEEPAEKKQKTEEISNPVANETLDKKRKSRARIRNRLRDNIDMNDDDEYIDEEKVSTWVVPSNQSGDGTTHLNKKYGY